MYNTAVLRINMQFVHYYRPTIRNVKCNLNLFTVDKTRAYDPPLEAEGSSPPIPSPLPSSLIPHPPLPLLISDVGLELEGTLINCSLL